MQITCGPFFKSDKVKEETQVLWTPQTLEPEPEPSIVSSLEDPMFSNPPNLKKDDPKALILANAEISEVSEADTNEFNYYSPVVSLQ